MSYDHRTLALRVEAELRANPRLTLAMISNTLQIDRHTVNRALFRTFGVTFRAFKASIQDEAISGALIGGKLMSIKQAAAKAGYGSAGSLARRTRRSMGIAPTKVRSRDR